MHRHVFVLLATNVGPTQLAAQRSVCNTPVELDSATTATDLVFYGVVTQNRPVKQVVSVGNKYSWMTREVGIKIERVWKGELLDTATLFVGLDSDTTRAIKVGKRYLVFGTMGGMTASKVENGRDVVDTIVDYKAGDAVYVNACSGIVSLPAKHLPPGGVTP
jgi:hypothetical protein